MKWQKQSRERADEHPQQRGSIHVVPASLSRRGWVARVGTDLQGPFELLAPVLPATNARLNSTSRPSTRQPLAPKPVHTLGGPVPRRAPSHWPLKPRRPLLDARDGQGRRTIPDAP